MKRALAAILFLSGCGLESWKYKSYPPNPYPDIQVVAVLPFANLSLEPGLDTLEFSNIFASELVKFQGFRVIRPAHVLKAMQPGERMDNVNDALRVARRLKADAVIAGAVTDFNPYVPPRIGISVQFLRSASRRLGGDEIGRIVQSASWRRGPLPLSVDQAGNWVTAFEEMYDAYEERIRSEVLAYGQAQEEQDSAYVADEAFMSVQPRYQQFVASQMLYRLFTITAGDGR